MMLFKPELCEKIRCGKKTQTRRLVHQDDKKGVRSTSCNTQKITAIYRNSRRTWVVDKCYAIQPGRGKKAIGRFRLLNIRREHLQDISARDAINEGVELSGLQDYPAYAFSDNVLRRFAELWDSINTKPGTRWQDNPEVWVLEFEVI